MGQIKIFEPDALVVTRFDPTSVKNLIERNHGAIDWVVVEVFVNRSHNRIQWKARCRMAEQILIGGRQTRRMKLASPKGIEF